jgi:formylglycine-generating enzyme required for sulfatase activity
MHAPDVLLRSIGKAVFKAIGPAFAGDAFVEALPDIARHAWNRWARECDEDQRRAELEALALAAAGSSRDATAEVVNELPPEQVEGLVVATAQDIHQTTLDIAERIAGDQPETVRESLAAYLHQVPAVLRAWLRRPGDVAGITVPARFALNGPDDLRSFLPVRLSPFRPGNQPLSGVAWELVELLGLGELGEVWKACRAGYPETAVALKFWIDPWSAKALRGDARLLDQLMLRARHPGIVPLRQTYLGNEPPCLEYEHVAGCDLAGMIREWQREHRRPSPRQVARVVRRLARIIAFAHRLDPPVVHRALKPSNVLVPHTTDGTLALRVADFGSGRVSASQAMRQSLRGQTEAQRLHASAWGSCAALYASPEQLKGADPDPRDDVYALGVIWHQLLTRDLGAGRPAGVRWAQRLQEQGVPVPLIELMGACCREDPSDRPRNAAVLVDLLGVLLQEGGEPSGLTDSGSSVDGRPAALPRRITNALRMTLAFIPPGTFRMGSPSSEAERSDDEGPQHEVSITRPYYLSIHPVTQGQYEAVMGENPSYFNETKGGGPHHPVESISWEEAVEFCRRLSEWPAERAAGRVYRLPTEAEWEYACRGGLPMPFATGTTLSGHEANFNGNYPYGEVPRGPYLERTTRVGSYGGNPFGLYDMHGNVWEWCADYYDRHYYKNSPRYDPPGPASGTLRVVRGGSCYNIGRFCRAAYRFGIAPANRDIDVGLRVAMTAPG